MHRGVFGVMCLRNDGIRSQELWLRAGMQAVNPQVNGRGQWHSLAAYCRELLTTGRCGFNDDFALLWPIPQRDLDINSALEQNPGY